jgi:hypothetical protein
MVPVISTGEFFAESPLSKLKSTSLEISIPNVIKNRCTNTPNIQLNLKFSETLLNIVKQIIVPNVNIRRTMENGKGILIKSRIKIPVESAISKRINGVCIIVLNIGLLSKKSF